MNRAEIIKVVEHAIRIFSSPTIGRGDVHGGQQGYIVYEQDGLPFIAAVVADAVLKGVAKEIVSPQRLMWLAARNSIDEGVEHRLRISHDNMIEYPGDRAAVLVFSEDPISRDKLVAARIVADTCGDCRQPFKPGDRRLIIGDRAYHEVTCGPSPGGPPVDPGALQGEAPPAQPRAHETTRTDESAAPAQERGPAPDHAPGHLGSCNGCRPDPLQLAAGPAAMTAFLDDCGGGP